MYIFVPPLGNSTSGRLIVASKEPTKEPGYGVQHEFPEPFQKEIPFRIFKFLWFFFPGILDSPPGHTAPPWVKIELYETRREMSIKNLVFFPYFISSTKSS